MWEKRVGKDKGARKGMIREAPRGRGRGKE